MFHRFGHLPEPEPIRKYRFGSGSGSILNHLLDFFGPTNINSGLRLIRTKIGIHNIRNIFYILGILGYIINILNIMYIFVSFGFGFQVDFHNFRNIFGYSNKISDIFGSLI